MPISAFSITTLGILKLSKECKGGRRPPWLPSVVQAMGKGGLDMDRQDLQLYILDKYHNIHIGYGGLDQERQWLELDHYPSWARHCPGKIQHFRLARSPQFS